MKQLLFSAFVAEIHAILREARETGAVDDSRRIA